MKAKRKPFIHAAARAPSNWRLRTRASHEERSQAMADGAAVGAEAEQLPVTDGDPFLKSEDTRERVGGGGRL